MTTAPTGTARVDYHVRSDWGSGFTAGITTTNTGPTPIADWVLAFSSTGEQRLVNGAPA